LFDDRLFIFFAPRLRCAITPFFCHFFALPRFFFLPLIYFAR